MGRNGVVALAMACLGVMAGGCEGSDAADADGGAGGAAGEAGTAVGRVALLRVYAEGFRPGQSSPEELEVRFATYDDTSLDEVAAPAPPTLGMGDCVVTDGDNAYRPPADGGPVTVGGLCEPIELTYSAEDEAYDSTAGRPDPACYGAGQTVTLHGDGGHGVGPFDARVDLPAGPGLTGPRGAVDIRDGLTVTWTAGQSAPGDQMFLALEGYDGLWGDVVCRIEDTGAFTVPAEVLAEAGAEPGGEPGYIWLVRTRAADFSADGLAAGRIAVTAVGAAGLDIAP